MLRQRKSQESNTAVVLGSMNVKKFICSICQVTSALDKKGPTDQNCHPYSQLLAWVKIINLQIHTWTINIHNKYKKGKNTKGKVGLLYKNEIFLRASQKQSHKKC